MNVNCPLVHVSSKSNQSLLERTEFCAPFYSVSRRDSQKTPQIFNKNFINGFDFQISIPCTQFSYLIYMSFLSLQGPCTKKGNPISPLFAHSVIFSNISPLAKLFKKGMTSKMNMFVFNIFLRCATPYLK